MQQVCHQEARPGITRSRIRHDERIVGTDRQCASRDIPPQRVFQYPPDPVDHRDGPLSMISANPESKFVVFVGNRSSYPRCVIKCPQAASICATAPSGKPVLQPPAWAERTKGTSWRVLLVDDQRCACDFSRLRISSAALHRTAFAIRSASGGISRNNATFFSSRTASSSISS